MDWNVLWLLLREPNAIWKVPLTLLLGASIIYITFKSAFALVRTVNASRHGMIPPEAAQPLRNQFVHFIFILACAVVILTILLMIWGIPRVLTQLRGAM